LAHFQFLSFFPFLEEPTTAAFMRASIDNIHIFKLLFYAFVFVIYRKNMEFWLITIPINKRKRFVAGNVDG